MTPHPKHIRKVLSKATPDEISEGLVWYKEANAFAKDLSFRYNLCMSDVAKIISILSPAVSWEINKRDTITLIEAYQLGVDCVVSTYGANKLKALRVLNGEDVEMKADKTRNFFFNILHPEDPSYITIDRHAIRVATGELSRGSVTVGRKLYKDTSLVYNTLSKKEGLLPNQLQAITWLTYRRINKGG